MKENETNTEGILQGSSNTGIKELMDSEAKGQEVLQVNGARIVSVITLLKRRWYSG